MNHIPVILCAVLAISASASVAAPAPSGLASASKLTEDSHRDSWTYRNPGQAIGQYQSFIIEPTAIYSDPVADWGSSTMEQRQQYAGFLTSALRDEIGKSYQIATKAGPGVAIMRLTLLGVKETVGGVATVTRVTPIGLAFNGVKSLVGKKGTLTGSLQVAFELTNSKTGELIFAAVRRRSPDALDIESTLSTEKTAEAVARDIATSIRKGLDKVSGRPAS